MQAEMAAENITVVVAKPHQRAEVVVIPNTLEALQGIVGGYIEELPSAWEIAGCVIVANEEGHPQGLPPNREWPAGSELLGTIVVVQRGTNADYASLSPEKAAEIVGLLEARKVGN